MTEEPIDVTAATEAQAADPNLPPGGFGLPLDEMSDSEMLRELVFQVRSIAAAFEDFKNMSPGELMGMLMGNRKKK